MPHPIYGPPGHVLEVVTARLSLPSERNGHLTRLELKGSTSTKRAPLWFRHESWARDEQQQHLEPVDFIYQAVLAASQDRPVTQDQFDRCTMPGGWEDVPLPF